MENQRSSPTSAIIPAPAAHQSLSDSSTNLLHASISEFVSKIVQLCNENRSTGYSLASSPNFGEIRATPTTQSPPACLTEYNPVNGEFIGSSPNPHASIRGHIGSASSPRGRRRSQASWTSGPVALASPPPAESAAPFSAVQSPPVLAPHLHLQPSVPALRLPASDCPQASGQSPAASPCPDDPPGAVIAGQQPRQRQIELPPLSAVEGSSPPSPLRLLPIQAPDPPGFCSAPSAASSLIFSAEVQAIAGGRQPSSAPSSVHNSLGLAGLTDQSCGLTSQTPILTGQTDFFG